MDTAVVATDASGVVTDWNAGAERLYGWSATEAVGRPARDLLWAPGTQTQASAIVGSVLAGGTWRGRFTVQRKDGSILPVTVTGSPVVNPEGSVVGVVVVADDAAKAIRVEQDLRASDEMFRLRFTDSPIPQAVLALDGTVTRANAALCATLGYPEGALLGRDPAELLLAEERERAVENLRAVLAGERRTVTALHRYLTAAGEVRWGEVTFGAVFGADGHPQALTAFMQDVTAEQRARQEAAAALQQLRASEQRFRSLVSRSADVAFIVDAEAIIVYASPAVSAVFGYQPEELEGRVGSAFLHRDDVRLAEQILTGVLTAGGTPDLFQLRIRTADGRYLWTEGSVTNSMDDPAIGGLILNLRDVSARKAADEALAASEARYRDIVENAEEGLWLLDADGCTTFANPRMSALLQRSPNELLGKPPTVFAHPEDAELIETQLRARRHGPNRYEARFLAADATVVWALVSARPLFDGNGNYIGTQALLTDITDRKHAEDQLRHLALHDVLTGLPNRTLLADRLEHAVARSLREPAHTAVLFVDLDDFKLINDSYGHSIGDQTLLAVAQRIIAAARREDTVARLGGDEFVVVCEQLRDREEASDIAHRILAAISEPLDLASRPIVITASIGVAYATSCDAESLLRDTDTAMYRAKTHGRARVVVFEPEAYEATERDSALIHEISCSSRARLR